LVELFVSGGIVTALEDAAVAVGRLDAALAGNPLQRAWGIVLLLRAGIKSSW
jgi:hypothetical protein